MSPTRPNILLIMADQWHHADVGYRGHPLVRTPTLDRLREESIDFACAYAQNAFCLPSRASLLTGQYARTHRQYGFTGLFDEATPCLPEFLRRHGYHTFHVGKHHCNPFADHLGFDEFIPTLPEDMHQATDPERSYMAWCRSQGIEYPNDQVHGDDVRMAAPPEPLQLGGRRLQMYGVSAVPLRMSIERYTAQRAIEFLDRPSNGRPFYLSLSFDRPHGPWTPSPEDAGMYDPADIPLPRPLTAEELSRMPDHIVRHVRGSKVGLEAIGEDGMRRVLALYYALITRIDTEIGRVLEALDRSGRADDTVVVFCTDHGDMAGRLGLFDKYPNSIYHDDIIRTPLLLRPPRALREARTVRRAVELIDLFPTLCRLAGLPTDDLPLDGSDLLSLPPGDGRPWSGTAFSESYGIKTVIKDGWKLIHYVNHDEGELYHLREDPGERWNLFGDPSCQARRIELLRELAGFFTPTPSERRQALIRSLFDDRVTTARQAMGKLFKWNKGLVEGDGFWQCFRDGHRLTVIPFDGTCRLERLDPDAPTDGLTWNYAPVEDPGRMEALLGELIDYIACKIRPISIMSGGDEARDRMLFSRGFGFC